MDISQMIFAPWQRQAELQQTQAQTAMQQMQNAAFPEKERLSQELTKASIEQHQASAQAQKQQMMMNAIAAWQAQDKAAIAAGRPRMSFDQFMQGGGINQPPQAQLMQQPQGAPISTPQQAMSAMGGGVPQVGQQGQMIDPFARISQKIAQNDKMAELFKAAGYPEDAAKLDNDSVQHAEKAASVFSSMQSGYKSQAERIEKEREAVIGMRKTLTNQDELERLRKSYPDNPLLVGDLPTVQRRLALTDIALQKEQDIATKKAQELNSRAEAAKRGVETRREQIKLSEETADYAARARNMNLDKAGDTTTPREKTFAGEKEKEKAQTKSEYGRQSVQLQTRAYTIYNAGEQAYASIKNLANTPAGTQLSATAGLAGKTGEGLVDAFTSKYARQFTPIEQRALQMDITGTMRDMLRFKGGGFATSVTEGAIKEFNSQLEREGDPNARGILTAMMVARLNQEYEAEAKAFKNHPGATKDQAASIFENANDLKQKFPMTVDDVWAVINKIRDPQKRQTISEQNKSLLKQLKNPDTTMVDGQRFVRPDAMTDEQWNEYKKAVGAK